MDSKHKQLCDLYMVMGNKTEAYLLTYPNHPFKRNVDIQNAVNGILRREECREYMAKKPLSKEEILGVLESVMFRQEEMGVKEIDIPAINKAVDIYNKMNGYYEPIKRETKETIRRVINVVNVPPKALPKEDKKQKVVVSKARVIDVEVDI